MTEPVRPFAFPDFAGDALCAETDPDAFFPDKGGSVREAKAVCARCEVTAECLAWALANGERHGVWGGTSEFDRRRIRRGAPPPRRPAHTWTDETTKQQILELTERGWSTVEIAREFAISTRTVSRVRVAKRAAA